ncbi:MAG: hypothetical protein ABJD11_03565 [Gemmatimonadota bacterium]
MEESLSSSGTFLMKFLFPVVWLGGFGLGTLGLWTGTPHVRWEGQDTAPPWAKWIFLAGLFLGAWLIGRIAVPLKRVILSGDKLLISNYFSEVSVPLTSVLRVGLSRNESVNNTPLAFVELKEPCAFGSIVQFIPRSPEDLETLSRRIRPVDGHALDSARQVGS